MKTSKPAQGHTYYQKGNAMPHAHTPGPWEVETPREHEVLVVGDNGACDVARLAGPLQRKLNNARLIAAAPEMLEALQDCLQALRHAPIEGCYGKDARYKAERVLAKANGHDSGKE